MRKLLYVFYPFCLWWDGFNYFSHLNAEASFGRMGKDYEPYDFSQDTVPKLKRYINQTL